MILRPLKWYAKLLTSKGRRRERRYLVEGRRQVFQMLETSPLYVEEILALEPFETCCPVRVVTVQQMREFTDSETTPEFTAVGIIPDECYASYGEYEIRSEKILFLENLQDPGNVGTLLRCAAAFGFRTVLMTDGCADPFAPKVVRSAAGVLPSLQILRSSAPIHDLRELQKKGWKIVTAHINGGFDTVSGEEKLIFALGNEGNGVSDELLGITDAVFTIPYDSSIVESLNAAVAGSIGMAQSYRK